MGLKGCKIGHFAETEKSGFGMEDGNERRLEELKFSWIVECTEV